MKRILFGAVVLMLLSACVVQAVDTITRDVPQLLPAASLSLQVFNTNEFDRIGIFTKFGNADTVTWRLYYAQDGTNYTLIDSTVVRCAKNGGYTGSYFYPETCAWRQLAHTATVGSNNTVHFDGFMYQTMLITVTNKAKADTANFKISLKGVRY